VFDHWDVVRRRPAAKRETGAPAPLSADRPCCA